MRSAEISGASVTGFGAGEDQANYRRMSDVRNAPAARSFGFAFSPITLAVMLTALLSAALFVAYDTARTFNDARRFGAMDLFATGDEHPLLAKLGPEPLGNAFHEAYLVAALAGKNTPIKSALLDQRIVAGLGNIYVCEALYRAGIHPARKARAISAARVAGLVPIVRAVLTDAIAAGGSSLRDYRQADGELGYFQHSFQVYGREGEPCPTDGCGGTVRRIVQAGRSSFYCPHCQR